MWSLGKRFDLHYRESENSSSTQKGEQLRYAESYNYANIMGEKRNGERRITEPR